MQSNPSPEPPPFQSKTKNCDTIERINTLVINLDLKLDQLCYLNCTKESDRPSVKCKNKIAKALKHNKSKKESAQLTQKQYQQPVEGAANATSAVIAEGTDSDTIEERTRAADTDTEPVAQTVVDSKSVAIAESAAREGHNPQQRQETIIFENFKNILATTSPALEVKITKDGFHNSLLRIEANADKILRGAKEGLDSRLRAGGNPKVPGLKGLDPKSVDNPSSNNKITELINKKNNNNNNTKNNNNNQKPNNNNNTKALTFKLNEPPKMNVISYMQPLAPTSKKFMSEPPQEKNADSVPLKTLSAIYRAKVIDAYRNRQIFTVFGNYNTIRRSLLKRGWLEKLPPSRHSKLQGLPEEVLLQHAKRGNEYEAVVISKIINHFPAFFVWQPKGQRDLYADVQPYRNRIRRTHMLDFSTKVGLIGCAEQQQWYLQDGVAGMLYPRFYRLGGNQEELAAFTDDFRITQCRSLLQYLILNNDKPAEIIDYENGTVPTSIIDFALARVRRQIDDWENVTALDVEATQIPDPDWNEFLTNSSKILNLHQKFKCTYRELTEFIKNSRTVLNRLQDKRPDFKWDGYKNLWILKPGYQSRGLGIIIRNNLEDILRWSSSHSNRRYIVQKYIEQPLLIYKTKFDIRQYMLVFIRESTVQIWLYKDCYLRFSSQEYSIDDLREVIHLTNNSVQKKYKNKVTRDTRLPKNNMWSLDQFKAFLKTQTSQEIWESKVFPGFRENLIAVVMASLDETNLSENSFELYGCDFMLDEQYNPILIEINSTPDLSASTEVTAHICPLVMQDCIKVVVDLPRNARATTGQFKLVYEVNYKFKQDINSKDNLNINGKSVELCKRRPTTVTPAKVVRKFKKAEVVSRVKSSSHEMNKKGNFSVNSKKSKISLGANNAQSLKASAKEVLALRYTIPK